MDERDLPGVIASPQQLVSAANGAIFLIASAKLVLAILMPVKTITLLPALQFREIVEWQQSFTGSIFTGLILLGLFLMPQRFTKEKLTAALVIVLGNFLLEFSCLWVCKSAHISSIAAIEGLAALSIYQGLRAESRSRRRRS